ncbi:uncharacterized protein isoform X2 [Macaca fascicularis]|uniref:uncharacterized protein isoform X2 n=1 Tax=Macaca fascicularis TaxID=9541 RepID=UPI003D15543C
MVLISGPRDLPASASQSAGITGVSHRARPSLKILNHISPYKWVHSKKATMSKPRREPSRGNQKAGWYLDLGLSSLQNAEVDPGKRIFRERTLFSFSEHRVGQAMTAQPARGLFWTLVVNGQSLRNTLLRKVHCHRKEKVTSPDHLSGHSMVDAQQC